MKTLSIPAKRVNFIQFLPSRTNLKTTNCVSCFFLFSSKQYRRFRTCPISNIVSDISVTDLQCTKSCISFLEILCFIPWRVMYSFQDLCNFWLNVWTFWIHISTRKVIIFLSSLNSAEVYGSWSAVHQNNQSKSMKKSYPLIIIETYRAVKCTIFWHATNSLGQFQKTLYGDISFLWYAQGVNKIVSMKYGHSFVAKYYITTLLPNIFGNINPSNFSGSSQSSQWPHCSIKALSLVPCIPVRLLPYGCQA